MTRLTGSCLCGAIRFAIATEVEDFYFCHCAQCRKLTGSAFAANLIAPPADIEWESGADYVRRFDYPGPRSFTKVFCSRCAAALPFVNEAGTTLIVPAGTLDQDPPIAPTQHIFWADRATWYEAGAAAPHCDGFP